MLYSCDAGANLVWDQLTPLSQVRKDVENKEKDKGLLIKACLNGARERGEHPALPLTPEEITQDAALVVAAGARALHIHPRNSEAKQSLADQDQAATLVAIRRRCPGIPVGVSTALWIEVDQMVRLQRVRAWTALPDFASVNFDEPGAVELCHTLQERGIGIEAGLSSAADVNVLLQSGLARYCLRVLIEPGEEETSAALATAEEIIRALDEAHIQAPRLLHGFGIAAWPLLDAALRYGYDTRIGLEDTLRLPDGRMAQGNAELVAVAVSKAGI